MIAIAVISLLVVASQIISNPPTLFVAPAATINPKCIVQEAKCAQPEESAGFCDRNPGQVNASCLGRHKKPGYRLPAWLWRYTQRWIA